MKYGEDNIVRDFARSSSTRGTWIEISLSFISTFDATCRPPPGGRGLKFRFLACLCFALPSSSTRGTWIEISLKITGGKVERKSSSTRGTWIEIKIAIKKMRLTLSRPPPGGRGLKYPHLPHFSFLPASSSTRGTWIEINPAVGPVRCGKVVLHPGDVD